MQDESGSVNVKRCKRKVAWVMFKYYIIVNSSLFLFRGLQAQEMQELGGMGKVQDYSSRGRCKIKWPWRGARCEVQHVRGHGKYARRYTGEI